LTPLNRWHRSADSTYPNVPDGHSNPQLCIDEALAICARVADLCFTQPLVSESVADSWLGLYSDIETWNLKLPSVMRPMLNSAIGSISYDEGTAKSFPLIMHTSRASFYGCLLYHITCLLLLQCKPRAIRGRVTTQLKTVTWHAVQLCGLSISNNITWSWDPVSVSVILHAGQLLSYTEQQHELLVHLQQLAKLTGWRIHREIRNLAENWQTAS
jgi:hypothetical protein